MPQATDITVITVQGMAVRSLCESRPSLKLDDAQELLTLIINIAAYEAHGPGTLAQRASAALNNPKVQELLPPWE